MNDGMRIGQLRMAYLDLATRSLSEQDFNSCTTHIDSFMIWVRENTAAETDLTKKWNEIDKEGDAQIEQKIKELGEKHLQKIEVDELIGNEAAKISVDSIKKKLNACVQVSLQEGLFSE